MLRNLQSAIAILICGCMVGYAAVPVSIGILVTDSPALIDGAPVRGNSTLFSGNVVKADSAASSLWFADGSSLVLQPGSQVRVFRDHSVLEQGTVTQIGSDKRALIADGLTLASLSEHGTLAAALRDSSHVEAVAENGPAEVRTAAGQLVARLNPGERLSFAINPASTTVQEPQEAPPPPPTGPSITVNGILRQEPEGEYKITNDTDGVEYIVEGSIPGSALGASVQIKGIAAGVSPTIMCHTPSADSGSAPCHIVVANSIRRIAAGSTKEEEGQAPTPAAEGPHFHSGVVIVTAAAVGGGALVAILALSGGKKTSTSAP